MSAGPVNIGQAALRSGVSPKMIRHYESLGLLPRVARTDSGYRQYGDADMHTLRFIKRARDLGFSVEECRALLALYHESERSNAEVKALAEGRVKEIDRRLADLASIRDALAHLAESCKGDARHDCPILDDLSATREQRSSAA